MQHAATQRSQKLQAAASEKIKSDKLKNLNVSSSGRTKFGFSVETLEAYMEKRYAKQLEKDAARDAKTEQYHIEQKAAMEQDRKEILSAVNGVSATQKVYVWYCQRCFSFQLCSVNVLPFTRIHVSPAAM
jgi:hypothetical protein